MSGINENDIFNNEFAIAALKSMNPDDVIRYKELGKSLFNSIDFENSKLLNNPAYESVLCLLDNIRDGLHPSDLDKDEKNVLADTLGDKWYEMFGYVEGDLDSIITLDPDLHIKIEIENNKKTK